MFAVIEFHTLHIQCNGKWSVTHSTTEKDTLHNPSAKYEQKIQFIAPEPHNINGVLGASPTKNPIVNCAWDDRLR
jgi:hypothetical protein